MHGSALWVGDRHVQRTSRSRRSSWENDEGVVGWVAGKEQDTFTSELNIKLGLLCTGDDESEELHDARATVLARMCRLPAKAPWCRCARTAT